MDFHFQLVIHATNQHLIKYAGCTWRFLLTTVLLYLTSLYLLELFGKDGSAWEQFFISELQELAEEQEKRDVVHLPTFTSNFTSQKQVVSKLEIPSLMGALLIWNPAFKVLTQQQFYSLSQLCFVLKCLSSQKFKSIVHLTGNSLDTDTS